MTVQELKALSRQVKMPKQDDILTISRHLRHNLAKAKDKMMHSLKNSSVTQDVEMYENLKTCPPTPLFEYEDDCSSVSSASSLPTQQPSQALIDPGLTDIASLYSSLLYTPLYTSLLDMNLMLQSGLEMSATNSIEATEEQINSWLQRGGGGTLSPIASLATDQELADLLDFDSSS
ncbi:hypothetical protein BY458DRAFT_517641 [Sporodiniella umbellata]|nr:hypothetical protein BY458DRAFT_517641 [Sporodiniella umbellata]